MSPMLKGGSRICLGLALWLFVSTASLAQIAEPFHIRNLNPLVAIFGLPAWEAVSAGPSIRVTSEVANHYRLSTRGADSLVLDGETLRTTFALNRGFAERWSVGVEVPHYQLSGGVLDDVIDSWHSVFGMPDGGRNNRPEDQSLFRLANSAGTFFDIGGRHRGVGDLQLKVARTLGADQGFVVQGTIKLPTGDEDMLAGSGSADWAITALRSRGANVWNRPAGFYWGMGAIRAGEPERIRFAAKTLVYTAIVGGSLQVRPRFGVKAQLDVHTRFYSSPLEEIGEHAIQATVGAWLRPTPRAVFDFAVVEDLEVSTAPDVVVQVAAHWSW